MGTRCIHQIWFQGQEALPPEYQKYQQSWRLHNPEFEYRLWDDTAIVNLLKKDPELLDIFLQCDNWGSKSDVARYFILHELGGIYIDMDTFCVNSLTQLDLDLKVPQLVQPPFPLYYTMLRNSLNPWIGPRFLSNYFIVTPARTPFFANALQYIKRHYKPGYREVEVTGPSLIMYLSSKYPCAILENTRFNFKSQPIDSSTLGVHIYAASWISHPQLKSVLNLRNYAYLDILVILGFILWISKRQPS